MLTESATLDAAPRSRRPTPPGAAPGGFLFGIASPIIPALENQWPSWLAPIGGGWKPEHPRSGSIPRRSL
ncbi:MAG TPA: hypothetical protein VFG07_06800 [Thermoplasmata archaeon]|nr:hypothetical protein [Thermoplasmata archaeon]